MTDEPTTDRHEVEALYGLDPSEFTLLVSQSHIAWQALGTPTVGPKAIEAEGLRFRRSLFVTRDVKAGERVSVDNVRSVRPADGMRTDAFSEVEGRPFVADLPAGTPLTWDIL